MQFKTKLGLVDIPNTDVLRAAREIEDRDCPHFVIVGYNGNRTPCAALTVYAATAGLDAVRANAVAMLHDAGFPQVHSAEAISWPCAEPKPLGNPFPPGEKLTLAEPGTPTGDYLAEYYERKADTGD